MLEFIKESGLILVLSILPLTIIANNLLGAAKSSIDIKDQFDYKKLYKGLAKGVVVYSGIFIYSIVSFYMRDLSVSIAGGNYNLVDAVYLIILAAIVRYSTDGISKLKDIMEYEVKEEDKDE